MTLKKFMNMHTTSMYLHPKFYAFWPFSLGDVKKKTHTCYEGLEGEKKNLQRKGDYPLKVEYLEIPKMYKRKYFGEGFLRNWQPNLVIFHR